LGCAYQGTGNNVLSGKYWEKASAGETVPAPAMFYNDQQPEMIFYQGLAWLKLNHPQNAGECFRNLIQYGENHLNDVVKIDYFAVSLPDMMIFDDDLNHRNKVHCHFLTGLGKLGLGATRDALESFNKVLELDSCHQGACSHRSMMQKINFNIT
jgi:hypothetical protein